MMENIWAEKRRERKERKKVQKENIERKRKEKGEGKEGRKEENEDMVEEEWDNELSEGDTEMDVDETIG